jgi:hypothetical protein
MAPRRNTAAHHSEVGNASFVDGSKSGRDSRSSLASSTVFSAGSKADPDELCLGDCGHDQRSRPAQPWRRLKRPPRLHPHQVASRAQGESDDQLPAPRGYRRPASSGRRAKATHLRVTSEPCSATCLAHESQDAFEAWLLDRLGADSSYEGPTLIRFPPAPPTASGEKGA